MSICPECRQSFPAPAVSCPTHGLALLPEAAFNTLDPELAPGTTIGEYLVEAKVGAGTFGAVYRGIHPLIGKQVAIKVLNHKFSADPMVVSRFISEARAVNQIRQQNIIDIFSFGQLPDGRHYHIMEYLEGRTLDAYLKERGPLAVTEALPILLGLARALDAAHTAAIAHRDLKPDNVFLGVDASGALFPKLLDFGIAKLLSDDLPRQHQTATGAAVGTPNYMSPEQCQGPNVDHRTDVYSFGVLMFQMLTGRLPFVGGSTVEVLIKHISTEPPRPSGFAPALTPEVDRVVLALMAKRPDDRPHHLVPVVEALEKLARGQPVDLDAALAPGPAPERRPRVTSSGARLEAIPSASASQIASTTPSRDIPRTMPDPTSATLANDVGMASLPQRGPRDLRLPLGLAGLVCLGLVGAVVATRTPAPPPAPPVAPVVTPAAPVRPATIRVELSGVPGSAEVLFAGNKLRTGPGPIELARGDAPIELEVRAEGFAPRAVSLTPAEDQPLAVELLALEKPAEPGPKAKPGKKKKKKGDGPGVDPDGIEDPFAR